MSSGGVGGTALAPGDPRRKGEAARGVSGDRVTWGGRGGALLEGIGLDAGQERIYLALLAAPARDAAELAARTGLPEERVAAALGAPEGRSYENPKPGVWELVVESRRTTPVFSAPFALEGSVTR